MGMSTASFNLQNDGVICDQLNDVLIKAFPGLVSELEEDGISKVTSDDKARLHITFANHSDAEVIAMTDHLISVLPETVSVESVSCTRASASQEGGISRHRRQVVVPA